MLIYDTRSTNGCRSWNIEIADDVMAKVEKVCMETHTKLIEMGRYQNHRGDGWDGGVVWLVPTFSKIEEWNPVAERAL